MVGFGSVTKGGSGQSRWGLLFGAWLLSVIASIYVVAPASVLSVIMSELSDEVGAAG